MAYLVEITPPTCDRGSSCKSARFSRGQGFHAAIATQELRTRSNSVYGRYCGRCAPVMLAQLQRGES